MITLVDPAPHLHDSWLGAIDEFQGETLHGFATHGFDVAELRTDSGFERWLAHERAQRTEGVGNFVPATAWWIVDDAEPERVLGSIHLRHELNGYLLAEGGHVGYGVRPSARGKGVATAALGRVIGRARDMGIESLLVTCDSGNPPSRATILNAGGALEDTRDTADGGRIERYWIALT